MNKKLALLGKLDTKHQAPFHDESFDIWVTGKHIDEHLFPRVTTYFDLHKNPARTAKGTVLRQDFPFGVCEALTGGNHFCSTMSYLIVYACFLGYEEIHIYGARFETDHAHRDEERRNVREMLMFARGRGVHVVDFDGVITREYPRASNDLYDFDSDFDM